MEPKSTPGDITSRKPLDAQFVGKVNQDAMKALGDVNARRKWGDGKSGSPVTTNILCAEIARLHLAHEWQPIAAAPRDPKVSLQFGFWNDDACRWEWLTHGAWDEKAEWWSDGERICPTHWRPIGVPIFAEEASKS